MKLLAFITGLCLTSLAMAWEPSRPITAYVGYGPGSGNEVSFRGVMVEIERTNPNVHFVVQNMPGADGMISVNHSSKLPADGYSLNVTGNLSTWVTNDAFTPDLAQYQLDELLPVLSIATSPQVIVARTNSPINTAQEFVKYIKNPGQDVNIAIGSTVQYLIYGLVMDKAHGNTEKVKQIMYKGPMQALLDVAGGHTEFGMMPLAVAAPLIEAGKVKLIAVTSRYRAPQFPNIPAINELLPGVTVMAMWNITLPKNTPKDIVNWYVKTFSTAIRSENVQRYFRENYMTAAADLDPVTAKKELDDLRKQYLPTAKRLAKEMPVK
jgi:tripartite-type tricarboxylate transporter receptor subunit TctC